MKDIQMFLKSQNQISKNKNLHFAKINDDLSTPFSPLCQIGY